MKPIVMKAGGAIIAEPKNFTALVGRVKEESDRAALVLVISALGSTTRLLEKCARAAHAERREDAERISNDIMNAHHAIASAMNADTKAFRDACSSFKKKIEELTFGVIAVKELSPRTLDAFLVCGEKLATVLVEEVLQVAGISVKHIPAETFMITDASFTRAHLHEDEAEKNIQKIISPLLGTGRVVLTEGFIGATENGIPTTMGYESSDHSATFIASALGAERVVIWKMVEGLFTADPAMISKAQRIESLSYREAAELARCGAKVLHERAVEPAARMNIPVYLHNVLTGTGTCVSETAGRNKEMISVTSRRDLVLVRSSPRSGNGSAWISNFFSELGRDAELVPLFETEGNVISFVAPRIILERSTTVTKHEVVHENVGVISIVTYMPIGYGKKCMESFSADVFSINTASPLSVSIVVPLEKVDDILNRIHEQGSIHN